MIPYKHECKTREDIKAARAQMFSLLRRPYPPPARELNCESMTFEEWINAANFGAGQQEDAQSTGHVHGIVAVLAWARGEDPTEWAAAKYTMPVRPGEHLKRGTSRVPVIGIDGKGNPIIGAAWDYTERVRQLVDLHLPLGR